MSNRFMGAPYPIEEHARGYLHTQSGIDQIKSDLLVLLQTNQGERVMMPNYGAGLRRFLFEPNDDTLKIQVRNLIEQQLRLWEPRVVIDQIDVIPNPDRSELSSDDDLSQKDSILLIKIAFFDPEHIQEVHNLELEVPLGAA